MFIFLSKLLPLFLYPLGLSALLLLLALLLGRRPRAVRWIVAGALLLLWLSSTSWVSMGLVRSLEQRVPPPPDLPPVEVAVVLGGATRAPLPPRPLTEVRESGDRLLYAAALYREEQAAQLLLTGGKIDWMEPEGTPAEAVSMAQIVQQMGVPREALWLEDAARNTYENGLFSARLLSEAGVERVLLVTSALHMPRAAAVFEKQGVEIIPAPTDYLVADAEWRYLHTAPLAVQPFLWLPQAENLLLTSRALKEYIGWAVYALRGWL